MRKTYKFENECCANCAAKIEDKISKLDGVNSAKVNFMLQRFTLDAEDGAFSDALAKSIAIFKAIEPDVVLNVK
ncbi:MAG: heavy metal-associated domain-containing protein [Eggerthellaceae bacterium]|nr:heavy metal-associated domain-containing protein [Eggerthellaceae bacterium]